MQRCKGLRWSNSPNVAAAATICVAGILLSACMSEALDRQAEQIRQMDEEIARQRREIDALMTNQQVQDQKQQDCSRAFRDYFDKAQGRETPTRLLRCTATA